LYTCRVIAYFVSKFVVMATRKGRGKILLAAFDGPIPNPSTYKCKDLADILYRSQIIIHFVTNFVAMSTRKGLG